MANPYIITYFFGVTTSAGIDLGNGDLALITLQFTVDDDGDNVTYLASNKNLIMKKSGVCGMHYDFDNYFLLPNEYTFEVADLDGELNDLLYDGPLAGKVRKEFYVKVELKYSGTFSYVVEFSGYNANDLLDYDKLNKTHIFTALPKTNILNSTYLYQRDFKPELMDGNPARSVTWPNNPLNLVFNKISNHVVWDWCYLVERTGEKGLINEIFKLINPDITVDIIQNWTFYGNDWPEYGVPNHEGKELTFEDLILDSNWIGSVFSYNAHQQIESVGDLIRLVAFEFGCMAGVPTQEKAFFKQMFYFDAGNVQTLGTLSANGYHKRYKFNKIDYADINSIFYKQDTNQSNRYVPQNYKPRGYSPVATMNKISGNNGLEKEIISCADTYFFLFDSNTASNIKAVIPGVEDRHYSIFGIKDEFIGLTPVLASLYMGGVDGFMPMGTFLAEYYNALKGLLYKTQIHEFTVDGLNYDFLKGFVHDGNNFSIIGMEKDFDKCLTTIEAIKIEQHTADGGEGAGGEVITDPLETIARYIAPYDTPLSYENATGEGIKIVEVNEGDWLSEIIVDLVNAYLANQIAGFRVYDGSETLLSSDEFDIYIPNTYIHRKIKKYTAPDTIYLEVTPGEDTPDTGYGTMIVTLLKKVAP